MAVMLRRALSAFLFTAVLLVVPATAQEPSDAPAAPPPQSATGQQKPPSKLKKWLKRAAPNCANVGGAGKCWSESEREKERQQQDGQQAQQQPPLPQNQAPPRSTEDAPAGVSSSRTTVDLSPPPNDAAQHEGTAISDVEELHQYDPHKAMKDVEVGDFYFKRGNYVAAESRYAGALRWKPNDAIATYRLAESQEKLGKFPDALKNYQGYLKILPRGEFADGAREGIARVSAKLGTAGKLQSKETPPSAPSARTPQ
jgi:tetratricopeptide (TPR) repeat protein